MNSTGARIKKLALEIDGEKIQGSVAFARGVLWVHIGGRTFTYEPPERAGRRGKHRGAVTANPGEIAAPMPGKIIKLMVKPGEKVAADQVLVVMEAMKMEYILKAQVDGLVAEVSCEPGQQVSLGEKLVKLDIA